jgi:hypothetical protein
MDVIFTLICVGLLSESSYFARHGGKPLPFSAPTKVIIGLVGLAAVAAMLLMLRAPIVPSSGSRVFLPTFGWGLPDWAVVLIMLVGFGENAVLLCKGIVGQSRMIAGRLRTAIEYSPLLVIALGGAYVLHVKSARRHAAVEAAVAAWAMERGQHKGVASSPTVAPAARKDKVAIPSFTAPDTETGQEMADAFSRILAKSNPGSIIDPKAVDSCLEAAKGSGYKTPQDSGEALYTTHGGIGVISMAHVIESSGDALEIGKICEASFVVKGGLYRNSAMEPKGKLHKTKGSDTLIMMVGLIDVKNGSGTKYIGPELKSKEEAAAQLQKFADVVVKELQTKIADGPTAPLDLRQ